MTVISSFHFCCFAHAFMFTRNRRQHHHHGKLVIWLCDVTRQDISTRMCTFAQFDTNTIAKCSRSNTLFAKQVSQQTDTTFRTSTINSTRGSNQQVEQLSGLTFPKTTSCLPKVRSEISVNLSDFSPNSLLHSYSHHAWLTVGGVA